MLMSPFVPNLQGSFTINNNKNKPIFERPIGIYVVCERPVTSLTSPGGEIA